jgi:hypothetical protein
MFFLIITILSTLIGLAATLSVLKKKSSVRPSLKNHFPGISILKPIRTLEPELEVKAMSPG